ncbi:MAG: hypothetical protein DMG49_25165 [Acidobacteria bacterium]|nr:MAG: hypothetical protein DMG49_25165 [Acidobacteriota bacterium]
MEIAKTVGGPISFKIAAAIERKQSPGKPACFAVVRVRGQFPEIASPSFIIAWQCYREEQNHGR